MPKRRSTAVWKGDLRDGQGTMKLGSGAFEGSYSFASRFKEGAGTNPEELLAAAHAGCFSMALAAMLAEAGHVPESIETSAEVTVEKGEGGFAITRSALSTRAMVPGIDEETFAELANRAKAGCPVSRALAGVQITLDAGLVS